LRYFIELAYNGGNYHGWQNQPNAVTVQSRLELALSTLLSDDIAIVGAGRTDTGVHARHMVAHFDTATAFKSSRSIYKLNSFLPNDIAIYDIYEVKPDTHARFDAISRTYHYQISTYKNPFLSGLAHEFYLPLDIELMNEASKLLLNYKDFQCFSKSNTDVKTYNCKIIKAEWTEKNHQLIFEITADRFLRNMVRAIVGTMINIGQGKLTIVDLHHIIKSKDRTNAGFSAPACGLYLTKVTYPDNIKL
jgi:tRNA pseudouridine38-40 synthase